MEFKKSSTPGGRYRRAGVGAGGAGGVTHRDRRAHLRVGDGVCALGGRPDAALESAFPCPLSFYEALPEGDVGLTDFEALAVERLRVLRAVEKVGQLGAVKYSREWANKMDEELGNPKGDLRGYSFDGMSRRTRDHLLARERDHFSHYILRLAYCHQEDSRRWLVQQECDLFRYRCMRLGDLRDFIDAYDLSYEPVPEDEMKKYGAVLEGLVFGGGVSGGGVGRSRSFYKVPFTEALDLVRSRKVLVVGGFCYVPDSEMVTLVAWIFKSLLTQALLFANKMLPALNEDERMVQVLGDLDKRYTGADYSTQEGDGPVVKPEMIRPLSQKSFPLCMRNMQTTMNATHHLKYKARLQYGLFLKGIGLSMEDSIRFFRQEFTQSHIDGDKFDKEYVYGIRYNYGREGKKVNWTPWNCMRIIMEAVGPGENHGCPYRWVLVGSTVIPMNTCYNFFSVLREKSFSF